MSKKTTFNEIRLDLTKHDRSKRRINEIKFVIIHYTNLQSTLESLKHLCNPFLKVSSHYLISENGVIFNLVSTDKSAWHAGESRWSNYKNLNIAQYEAAITKTNKFMKSEEIKKMSAKYTNPNRKNMFLH